MEWGKPPRMRSPTLLEGKGKMMNEKKTAIVTGA